MAAAGAGLWWALAAPATSASSWAATAAANSSAQAKAQALPSAPTGATVSCKSSGSSIVIVSWAAVTHAATYSVYQSTTSANSGFSPSATGVATTSWTSGNLGSGTYWYKVTVTVGSNWTSAQSASTLEASVTKNSSCTII